jgi:hypothetical protein
VRAVSEVRNLFSHFNSAKTSDRASRRCWASADATLRAHKPLSPIRHGRLGAVAPCRLGRVGFDLVAPIQAAHDQPHPGCRSISEGYWRSRLRFHSCRWRFLAASVPRRRSPGFDVGFVPPPALPARACRGSSATPSPAARGETGHPRDPSRSQLVAGRRRGPKHTLDHFRPLHSFLLWICEAGSTKRDRAARPAVTSP